MADKRNMTKKTTKFGFATTDKMEAACLADCTN